MVPHFFNKEAIGNLTHPQLLRAIEQVRAARNQRQALQIAYDIVTKHFKGKRFYTYLVIWKAFEKDPNCLWDRTGHMHCTHQNYLLRILLVRSGWFEESDIRLGHSLIWFISPHQYLKVRLDGKWIALDPWNSTHGAALGQYASGFGLKSL